ncbi:MAG: RraA family protein, partial [bacterium]
MLIDRKDPSYFEAIRERLYVSVVSDVLDEFGVRNRVLPARIRPLDEDLTLVGYARTGLYRDVYHVAENENP